MSKQAMQQAIEALQDAEEVLHFQKESKRLSTISPAIEALKVAIDATPEPKQNSPMPCIYCDNGEGDCAFPYYGKAPHDADTYRILPECQWPDNFVSDPENPECGEYTHCMFCGSPTKPDDMESLKRKLKESLRENFTLAAGQCTKGGPWSDEGGSSYCKYSNKSEPTQDEGPVAYLYDLDAYCDHRPEQDVLARKIPKGIPSEYLKNVRPLYLHPAPRPEFVRLSEDEICEMANEAEVREWSDEVYNFARAIENALEEKNRG